MIIKNAVLGDFSIKNQELPLVCCGLFVYSGRLGVIYDSQVTDRSVRGEGSHRESSLFPIGHPGVKYNFQPHS
jgi:hypothetical protein